MNKFSLFLIMSIAVVVATALMSGSIVVPALAQGNGTSEVEVGLPAAPPPGVNMSMPLNNVSNVTTAMGDSVLSGAPQVETPQGVETSGSEDEGSGSEDEGSGSEDEGSGSEDEGSGSE